MKNLSFILVFFNLIIYASEIPGQIFLYIGSLFVVGLIFFQSEKTRKVPSMIRKVMTTTLLIVGALIIYRLFKPLLTVESSLCFLLLLLILKLYELESYNDYFHLFLIMVLVQSGILILNPTFFSLIFSLVNIFLTFIFIIRINQYQLGTLNLKRLGLYLLPALPICFLLFVFFPRFTSGFLKLPDPTAVTSGFNPEINFTNLSSLNLNTKTVFRANFDESNLPLKQADLYWRGTVLWDTDGLNWREGHYNLKNTNQVIPMENSINYQLVFEDSKQLIIPLLEMPVEIDVESSKIDHFSDKTFQFRHLMYTKNIVMAKSQISGKDMIFDNILEKKSLKVKKFSSPQIEKLLKDLYADNKLLDQKQKLERLKNYFKNGGFTYTLTPPMYDSIESFLFGSKLGYCSHFSTSFALLARLSGIPTRVINGYQGGEYNKFGNFYTIEGKDAHSWVEVYDNELGWTRIDPTELVYPLRISLGAEEAMRQLDPYIQFANLRIERKNFDFKWLNQIGFFTSMINNNLSTWFYEFDQDYQKFLTKRLGIKLAFLPLFLVSILILGFTLIYLVMRAYQFHQRYDQVVRPYAKFIKTMEKKGLIKDPHEGPLHFKQRCLEHFPEMSEQIGTVIDEFIMKRYGTV